ACAFRCRKDVDPRASRRLTAVSGRERRPRDLIDERVLRVVILEAVLHRVRLEDVRRLDLVLFVQALVASLVHAADSARDDVGRDSLVRITPRVDRRQLTDLVERAREAGLDQKAGAEQAAVPYCLLMAAVIQRAEPRCVDAEKRRGSLRSVLTVGWIAEERGVYPMSTAHLQG